MTAMKAIKGNIQTNYHKYDKWFTITKILLTLAPFIALIYLQAFIGGSNLSELLQQNPKITLTFLVSMAGPFTAYLLGFAQKHLHDGDAAYMMAHLAMLFVVELLLRNGVYSVLMICLMFFVYRMTGMSPLEALRLKLKNHFFRDLSGCIVLIVFAMFCLFVSLRLGM